MDLKYKQDIINLNLSNCPDHNSLPKDTPAYRWCNSNPDEAETWLTVAELNKKNGTFPRGFSTSDAQCNYFALSFYNTYENAYNRFNGFPDRTKSKLGYTHISFGQLTKNDGVCTHIEFSGHFNLHEYKNVSFIKRFIIVGQL